MTDEELVEKAAEAMAILDDYDGCFERLRDWANATAEQRECREVEEPMSMDVEDAEDWRKRARAALAVFREAQKPTDDEREALARVIFLQQHPDSAGAWDAPGDAGKESWRLKADTILAAGFHRTEQGEPEWEYGYCCAGELTTGGKSFVHGVDYRGETMTRQEAEMRGGVLMRRTKAVPAGPWVPAPDTEGSKK